MRGKEVKMMSVSREVELHALVKDFYKSASLNRPSDEPVTVADLNHLAANLASALDTLISKMCTQ